MFSEGDLVMAPTSNMEVVNEPFYWYLRVKGPYKVSNTGSKNNVRLTTIGDKVVSQWVPIRYVKPVEFMCNLDEYL